MRWLDTAELRGSEHRRGCGAGWGGVGEGCSEVCVLGKGKEGVKHARGDLMDLKATGEGNTQSQDCD